MVIKDRGREGQASSHIFECVVSNQPEPLQGETTHRPLLLGLYEDPIDPVIKALYLLKGMAYRTQEVTRAALAAEDHVLPTRLPQLGYGDDRRQEGKKSNGGHDGHHEGQLFVRKVRHGGSSYTLVMRPDEVKDLLTGISDGTTTIDEAFASLRRVPTDNLGFARLDTHRELRQGLPEAIYAEGKTTDEVLSIAARLLETTSSPVLATRCTERVARLLIQEHPGAIHHERARLVTLRADARTSRETSLGTVAVLSAGTSDLPVAEEALYTSRALGAWAEPFSDVGVAGVHRLLEVQDQLHEADVVIVVAGMEGALASLVGGIASAPVVAVPTSVGYGASFDGLAALLAMLNSCAAGVAVMNIDNGFGAAVFAHRLLRKIDR